MMCQLQVSLNRTIVENFTKLAKLCMKVTGNQWGFYLFIYLGGANLRDIETLVNQAKLSPNRIVATTVEL